MISYKLFRIHLTSQVGSLILRSQDKAEKEFSGSDTAEGFGDSINKLSAS